MRDLPRVSVIMPVYKEGRFLANAIESILTQTFQNFELLLICDDLKDSTRVLLNKFAQKDPRIKIHMNTIRLGLVASRNKGCLLARGEYLNQMDSDDISDSQRLQVQIDYLDNYPDIGAVGTGNIYINESGNVIRKFQIPSSPGVVKWTLFFENKLAQSTILIRKDLIQKLGYYNENYTVSEDYDLWIRASRISKIAIIPKTLLQYRIHKGNVSRSARDEMNTCATEINRRFLLYEIENLSNRDLEIWNKYFLKNSLDTKEDIKKIHNILQKLYSRYTTTESLTYHEKKEIFRDMGFRYAMLAYVSKKTSFFLVIKYMLLALTFDGFILFKLVVSGMGRYIELRNRVQ